MSNPTNANHPATAADVYTRTANVRVGDIVTVPAERAERVLVRFDLASGYRIHLTCVPFPGTKSVADEVTGVCVVDANGRTVASNRHNPDADFVDAAEVFHVAGYFTED